MNSIDRLRLQGALALLELKNAFLANADEKLADPEYRYHTAINAQTCGLTIEEIHRHCVDENLKRNNAQIAQIQALLQSDRGSEVVSPRAQNDV